MWEFPGGKVEAGESPQAALVREVWEELGISVVIGALVARGVTQAEQPNPIDLACYYATPVDALPVVSAAHDKLLWLEPKGLDALHWTAPDLAAVRVLKAWGYAGQGPKLALPGVEADPWRKVWALAGTGSQLGKEPAVGGDAPTKPELAPVDLSDERWNRWFSKYSTETGEEAGKPGVTSVRTHARGLPKTGSD
jgi:8-oxo-dGTP diphosphatase